MKMLAVILYPIAYPLSLAMLRFECKLLAQEYQKWDYLRGCSLEGEKWTENTKPQLAQS